MSNIWLLHISRTIIVGITIKTLRVLDFCTSKNDLSKHFSHKSVIYTKNLQYSSKVMLHSLEAYLHSTEACLHAPYSLSLAVHNSLIIFTCQANYISSSKHYIFSLKEICTAIMSMCTINKDKEMETWKEVHLSRLTRLT